VDGIRFDAGSGKLETLEVDLVVDASGRRTLTLALLDAGLATAGGNRSRRRSQLHDSCHADPQRCADRLETCTGAS
jgi:hypothetical protein